MFQITSCWSNSLKLTTLEKECSTPNTTLAQPLLHPHPCSTPTAPHQGLLPVVAPHMVVKQSTGSSSSTTIVTAKFPQHYNMAIWPLTKFLSSRLNLTLKVKVNQPQQELPVRKQHTPMASMFWNRTNRKLLWFHICEGLYKCVQQVKLG